MSSVHPITKDQLKNLLKRLKKEIYRRSGWDENGNYIHDEMYRHYNVPMLSKPDNSLFDIFFDGNGIIKVKSGSFINQAGDNVEIELTVENGTAYFSVDNPEELIKARHGSPLINMLLEICDMGDMRHVKEYDIIPQSFDLTMLSKYLDELESDTYDTPTPHCRGACIGLCMNACTTTCSGSCIGNCASCSNLCSGECDSTCTGCSTSCGTTCGVICGVGCASSASGCAGCVSSCNTCTGCTGTCIGGCLGCSYSCAGKCLGGCLGTSGYNNTCGCGNDCNTGCGKVARSPASNSSDTMITLYHNNQVYGTITTPSAGLGYIQMPLINDLDNVFMRANTTPMWMDDDGNLFATGSSVRFSANTSQYNTCKSSKIPTTKCTTLYSRVFRMPALKYPHEVHYSSIYTPVTTVTTDSNSSAKAILTLASVVKINSNLGNVVSSDTYGAKIDGKPVVLPYSKPHPAGTVIELKGSGLTLKYNVEKVDEHNITISPEASVAYINPRAFVLTYTEERGPDGFMTFITYGDPKDCELDNNPHASVNVGGINITGETACRNVNTVKETVGSNVDLGAKGLYHGLVYGVTFEDYRPGPGNAFTLEGNKDTVHNVFVMNSRVISSSNLKCKIPITIEKNGYPKWTFTVPSRESMGFGSSVKYLIAEIAGSTPEPWERFEFGQTYSVYTRQDFYLYPY